MIRVGAVGAPERQTTYDVPGEPAQPLIPRPRSVVDTGAAARPPAA